MSFCKRRFLKTPNYMFILNVLQLNRFINLRFIFCARIVVINLKFVKQWVRFVTSKFIIIMDI